MLPVQDAGRPVRRDFLERARHLSSIGGVIKKLRANLRCVSQGSSRTLHRCARMPRHHLVPQPIIASVGAVAVSFVGCGCWQPRLPPMAYTVVVCMHDTPSFRPSSDQGWGSPNWPGADCAWTLQFAGEGGKATAWQE